MGKFRSVSVLRLRSSERGATVVEAAIGVPVFLIFLFTTFQLLRLAYVGLATQFAVNAVLRNAVVGPATYQTAATPTQGDYIHANLIARTRRLAVNIQPSDIEICEYNDSILEPKLLGCGSARSGNKDSFMEVTIRTKVDLGIGSYTVSGVAYAKNENWM